MYLKIFGYKTYLLTNNAFIKRVRTDLKVRVRVYIK